jgi:hypothetical protein
MSLNRSEQTVFDYLKTHPDERQYWQDKVRGFVTGNSESANAVTRIDSELWRYYIERSAVLPSFDIAQGPGAPRRISMKNLAELLVRLWTDPKPRKATPSDPDLLP